MNESPSRVAMLRLGITRSYTCSIYSEPDSVSRLIAPLNTATPARRRALACSPNETGSSDSRFHIVLQVDGFRRWQSGLAAADTRWRPLGRGVEREYRRLDDVPQFD